MHKLLLIVALLVGSSTSGTAQADPYQDQLSTWRSSGYDNQASGGPLQGSDRGYGFSGQTNMDRQAEYAREQAQRYEQRQQQEQRRNSSGPASGQLYGQPRGSSGGPTTTEGNAAGGGLFGCGLYGC